MWYDVGRQKFVSLSEKRNVSLFRTEITYCNISKYPPPPPPVGLLPKEGHDLIHEVYRSHTMTHDTQ